jgi:hypothetical protein
LSIFLPFVFWFKHEVNPKSDDSLMQTQGNPVKEALKEERAKMGGSVTKSYKFMKN